jgi:hypothetical protein
VRVKVEVDRVAQRGRGWKFLPRYAVWEGEPNCNAGDAKNLGKVFEMNFFGPQPARYRCLLN